MDKELANLIGDWKSTKKVSRLWKKDASLWTNSGESKWLGWLDIPQRQLEKIKELELIQNHFKSFESVALLGMGGSSLGPEVIVKTFGHQKGFPHVYILDSTDPEQILSFEKKLNLKKTAFIVASKSGGTLEPNLFLEYFYSKVKAGENFFAITDPGSSMEKRARELSFKGIYYGEPTIGGRYSVLSNFGVIPALAAGVDIKRFLNETLKMIQFCKEEVRVEENPGVLLGLALGSHALKGRNKLTLIPSGGWKALPYWIEQLVAESTGKSGKGIIPFVEDEVHLEDYGPDRVFVFIEEKSTPDHLDKISSLKKMGHPVIVMNVRDSYNLGQEFFGWEVATAVAGSVLKINPFDQPDVEANKLETKRLMGEVEKTGGLNKEKCLFEDANFRIFADQKNSEKLLEAKPKNFRDFIQAHLRRVLSGDYFGLLAFIEMNSATETLLNGIKGELQTQTKAATCVGFGPRYLHSTGQAFKGGPDSGVFFLFTTDHERDLDVPNHNYSFESVELAQGIGDFKVMAQKGRRIIRIHLKNSMEGLELFRAALK